MSLFPSVFGRNHPGALKGEIDRVFDDFFAGFPAMTGFAAGDNVYMPALDLKETKEGFERLNAINTTGVFLGMKHAARTMIDAGNGGAIVNISSIAGLGSSGGLIAYAASKWAVRGMTKAAANTLAKSNIRVNSIHPGLIQTDMLDEVFTNKTSKGNAEKNAHVAKSTVPLGRVADPMEVARLALFLSSEMSSYSTGSEFVVDGGNMGAAM